MFFRTAIVLAATAFAAFTSAAPSSPINAISQKGGLANVAGQTGDVAKNNGNNNEVEVLDRRGNLIAFNPPVEANVATRDNSCSSCNTINGVTVFVQAEVDVLTKKCKDTVAAGPITVDVAVNLIAEVKAIVVKLTALIQAVIALKLDINACLGVEIHACVSAIVKLIVDILACIDVVIKACIAVKIDLTAVLAIVAEVVALVLALVKIILSINVTLSALICAALTVAIKAIACIDVTVIVKLCVSVLAGVKLL